MIFYNKLLLLLFFAITLYDFSEFTKIQIEIRVPEHGKLILQLCKHKYASLNFLLESSTETISRCGVTRTSRPKYGPSEVLSKWMCSSNISCACFANRCRMLLSVNDGRRRPFNSASLAPPDTTPADPCRLASNKFSFDFFLSKNSKDQCLKVFVSAINS